MDVTIVTSMMMLKAWELGVGSCWVKYYDPKDVVRAFELPENIVPACILDMGYPAENAHPREDMHFGSKTVEEMTVYL